MTVLVRQMADWDRRRPAVNRNDGRNQHGNREWKRQLREQPYRMDGAARAWQRGRGIEQDPHHSGRSVRQRLREVMCR